MIFLFLVNSNGPLEAEISSDHEGNSDPQKPGGPGGTFDFLHLDLFVIVYLVFFRICVCVSVFVIVFVFFETPLIKYDQLLQIILK